MIDSSAQTARVGVVIGSDAPELERYAAAQLCAYLDLLFGIDARPTSQTPTDAEALFLVGSLATHPLAAQTAAPEPLPPLSDQG